jgi:CBS domain-containing protein
MIHEKPIRSLFKSLSFRIVATATTMTSIYILTGDLSNTLSLGVIDFVAKLLLYYFHERFWNMTNFGTQIGVSIENAMRSPPITAQSSETASTLMEEMVSFDIGSIIILEGDEPVGIVTEKDIVRRVLKTERDILKTRAKDIMSSPLKTIEVSKTLEEALKIMAENNIRRLCVIKDGKLSGVVTQRRILYALRNMTTK